MGRPLSAVGPSFFCCFKGTIHPPSDGQSGAKQMDRREEILLKITRNTHHRSVKTAASRGQTTPIFAQNFFFVRK